MIEPVRAFRRHLQEASAGLIVPTPHGLGLFCDELPLVYDANYVRADTPAAAAQLAAEAEAVMERFQHRRVVVETDGGALAPGFAELGWSQSTHLVLVHARPPDRVVDTSAVREVPLEAIEAAHTLGTLAETHGGAELAAQLFASKRRLVAACRTRFFATHDGGRVTAYCELRTGGGVSQIEDVNTLAAHRGRGLGRAVVQRALDEGRAASEIVFIEALADDWPKELYARLGFQVIDERHLFLRAPHPLTRLRLRTPRLELRLGSVAELRALAELARRGIHPPEAMPFYTPWTDDSGRPTFVQEMVDHHLGHLTGWRSEHWTLALIAFRDGHPVGVQSLRATDFGETRTVDTGSWLGLAEQGKGLGKEMRAAVLTLAFEHLGAAAATSGAIQGNEQSLGVSRAFGYEVTGESAVSPRGTPVAHTDLTLARSRFTSPVTVEVEGLEGLEPFFVAAP